MPARANLRAPWTTRSPHSSGCARPAGSSTTPRRATPMAASRPEPRSPTSRTTGSVPSAARGRRTSSPTRGSRSRLPATPRLARRSRFGRHAVLRHHAVVVDPDQLDHVEDVGLRLDPARGPGGLVRRDGMRADSSLFAEPGADFLGEPEVGDIVSVQVPELAAADREAELAAAADTGLDPRPGRDLLGDAFACSGCLAH